MKIPSKMFYAYEREKRRKWGRIIDRKNDRYIIYLSTNPLGYKVYEELISSVTHWINEKFIFRKDDRCLSG